MRHLFFLMLLSCLFVLPLPIVLARGGQASNIDSYIDDAPLIVHASILSSDDVQQNALIQVERYLKGTGGEYLLIVQQTIGTTQGWITGNEGHCVGRGAHMLEGTKPYIFLYPDPLLGTYSLSQIFYFPDENASLNLKLNDEYVPVNEAEFLELLSHYTDEPSEPLANQIPLRVPLRIITESGANYLLPVDGSAPIPLTADLYISLYQDWFVYFSSYFEFYQPQIAETCPIRLDCIFFSPDALHIMVQTEDSHSGVFGTQSGDSFLFAPSSDSIALWNADNLEIRSLPTWQSDLWRRLEARAWDDNIINSQALSRSDYSNSRYAAWSPDGQQLAFSDAAGVWLWDVYNVVSKPRLLLEASDETPVYLRFFSPLGTHLAVAVGDSYEYLNIASGEHLPDGSFSPNEQVFIHYDTQGIDFTSPLVCSARPFVCPEMPDDSSIPRYIQQLEWLDDWNLLITWCYNGYEPEADWFCNTFRESAEYFNYGYQNGNEIGLEGLQERSFAYESANNHLALLNGDYQLAITPCGNSSYTEGHCSWRSFDLSASLNSPIVEVQWLPSFFYHIN